MMLSRYSANHYCTAAYDKSCDIYWLFHGKYGLILVCYKIILTFRSLVCYKVELSGSVGRALDWGLKASPLAESMSLCP